MMTVLDEALDAVAGVDLAGLTDVEVHERLLGPQAADPARRVIRNWIRSHDREGDEERSRKRHAGRHLAAGETFDGMIHLQGLLPAVGGHELLNELYRLEHQLYLHDQGEHSDPADQGTGEVRTTWQRRADALVEMARRSATLDDREYHAGRAPRIGFVVVVGMNTVEHLCETLAGTPLPTGELVPTLDRADITRSTHPTVCDDAAEICDVDHVVPDADGGPTSIDNGRLHCRRHDRNPTLRARAPTTRRIRRPLRGWIPDTGSDTRSEPGDEPDR